MSCLAWNCKFLRNLHAIQALQELINKEGPHVVFLYEIRLHVSRLERIRIQCRMSACFGINAKGIKGGLAMMWRKDTHLFLRSFFQEPHRYGC